MLGRRLVYPIGFALAAVLISGLAVPSRASAGGQQYAVVSVATGKCLAVRAADAANGAEVVERPCAGAATQRWYADGRALANAASGKCLAMPNASRSWDAGLVQWDCPETITPQGAWNRVNYYVSSTRFWARLGSGRSGMFLVVPK